MTQIRHEARGPHPQGAGPAPQLTLADIPPRPYAYHGTDHTEPDAVTVVLRRRPARKRGSLPIDPGGPDVPFSAPAEWLAELAEEGL